MTCLLANMNVKYILVWPNTENLFNVSKLNSEVYLSDATISLQNPKILLRSMNACFIVSIAELQYKHIASLLIIMCISSFVDDNSAV